ncbi:hypothetical protein ACIBHX_33095 [Nonomuraea sp. NPDC050536]|uniref:hypothetical protein n=1 Tax=Nonomuraea sp. NPDC050536 TaxID=3364366 RepID=UPI0037C53174
MRSRTAISAGVLAMALSAIPALATAAGAEARDCSRGGGLLSGVTNGLCDVVGAVTGTVDNLTGDSLKPVTKGVDGATDGLLGTVGQVAPTATAKPTPSARKSELLPDAISEVCLPVLACGDQSVLATLTPRPTSSQPATVKPTPTASPRRTHRQNTPVLPTEAPTMPQNEPYLLDTTEKPVTDDPTADTDQPRIDLLWPNPNVQELTSPLNDQRVVRPVTPASDVIGTSLTIALLLSAVAATRIVQQRRQRGESIPFERRSTTGRHRLAQRLS